MAHNRLFLIGMILLFLGIQLRLVKTFELNERASAWIEAKFPSESPKKTVTSYVSYDPYTDLLLEPAPPAGPKIRSISPPRWLGWSFLSVGAVLVLTCPCFRNG